MNPNHELEARMKKLSKTQQKDRGAHLDAINAAHSDLEVVINKYNTEMSAAKDHVESAQAKLNEALDAARSFCADVLSEMDSYESERSDKWHESDAGSAFADWKSEWESVELDDVDVELPDDVEIPDNPADNLDGLSEEASG